MSLAFMSSRSFTVLPLSVAVCSVLLSGCSNTSPARYDTSGARPMVVKRPNAQNAESARPARLPSGNVDIGSFGQTTASTTTNDSSPTDDQYANAILDDDSLDELADLLEATNMEMVEGNRLAIQKYGDLWKRLRAGYGIDKSKYAYNARIEAQKKWFISRQDYLNRLTARASRYLYHTVREAERRNIPTELALLPVIESSYDPSATSNASAAGLWQFIPSTGRIYGLNQSNTYDGRRDVIESTRAAYDFLTALHNQFGSWELALAAYNAGPGRVQNAIDRNAAQGLPTDFWSLDLPAETKNYVPRFLAVAQIIAHPDNYNVYLPAIANRQHFRSVPVNYGVSLAQVSNVTGTRLDELEKLNPALINEHVDVSGPNRVVIPNNVTINDDKKISALQAYNANSGYATNSSNIYQKEGALPTSSGGLAAYASSADVPNQTTSYIAPNNTTEPPISNIEAKRINDELKQSNSLPTTSAQVTANNTIVQEPPLSKQERDFIAQQIQSQSPDTSDVVSSVDGNIKLNAVQTQQSILAAKGQEKRLSYSDKDKPTPKPKGKRSTYTVKHGDTLSNIASRAGVSWRDIADWNQIDPRDNLLAGSTLYLYNAKPIQPLTSQVKQSRPDSYVVQSGDTLIGTANRFGLSVSQLASYNNLNTRADLLRGQRLWLVPGKVTSGSSSTASISTSSSHISTQSYRVQAGDGLIALAKRFNMSVSDLAVLNDLSVRDDLYVGQRLKVPSSVNVAATANSTSSASNVDTTAYKVQAGDTLNGIANDLNLSRSQIAAVNSFDSRARLLRGQTIQIPADANQVKLALNNQDIKYRVQSGDTLTGLARRYHMSIAALAAANQLSTRANLLRNSVLTIPGNPSTVKSSQSSRAAASTASGSAISNTTRYKIQSGDSLIGLARKYNVSLSDLAVTNNMATDAQLLRGQTLKVPANGASSSGSTSTTTRSSGSTLSHTTRYKVQSGDSLIGLARQYGVSTQQLADMNNIKADTMLQRGQTLTVPNR